MSTFSLFLKKILLTFLLLLNNFLITNKIESISAQDPGLSKERLNRNSPNFLTGGHGLVSTINDYMKFCMMFLKKGKVNNNSI